MSQCAVCQSVEGLREVRGVQICERCERRSLAYRERREGRIERLGQRAAKAMREGMTLQARARQMSDAIPFGQPILVGHHSEGRDRRYRERIHQTFHRGYQAMKKASRLQERAERAESKRAISSDDPMAVVALREKIAAAKAVQERMKAVNAAIRRHAKKGREAQVAALVELGISAGKAARLLDGDYMGRVGFADYELKNNGANIRRMEKRLAELEKRAAKVAQMDEGSDTVQEEWWDDVRLVRDYDENRVRLHFPGKPSAEGLKLLKGRGFRWSPSNRAWQRQLNYAGEYAAKAVLNQMGKRRTEAEDSAPPVVDASQDKGMSEGEALALLGGWLEIAPQGLVSAELLARLQGDPVPQVYHAVRELEALWPDVGGGDCVVAYRVMGADGQPGLLVLVFGARQDSEAQQEFERVKQVLREALGTEREKLLGCPGYLGHFWVYEVVYMRKGIHEGAISLPAQDESGVQVQRGMFGEDVVMKPRMPSKPVSESGPKQLGMFGDIAGGSAQAMYEEWLRKKERRLL